MFFSKSKMSIEYQMVLHLYFALSLHITIPEPKDHSSPQTPPRYENQGE